MLKNIAVIFWLLIPYSFLFSQEPVSEDQGTAFYIYTESEFCSKYIFRGIVLEDNRVFQPAVYAGYTAPGKLGTFSAGVWFNFSMSNDQNLLNEITGEYEIYKKPFTYNETDLYLMHEMTFKELSLKNTFAVYLFTEETGYPNTTEYILNTSYPLGQFSLANEFACDISAYPGAFVFTHGLNWENEITDGLCFASGVNLIWGGSKYNSVNAGIKKVLINSLGLDASLTYSHRSGFYTKLRYQYNKIPEDDIRQSYGYDTWFFGLLAGFTF